MKPFALHSTLTLALLGLCSSALGQDARSLLAVKPKTASFGAAGIAATPAGLLAGGPDYRARFDHGSLELTPALGRKATKTYPFRFTLEAVTRGSAQIWRGPDPLAKPRHQGDTVWFDRGTFTERYQALDAGVEQSFVFDQPLPGQGDLVVRGRVHSELGLTHQSDRELRFEAEQLGGVKIGEVIGIDARGARVVGALRWSNPTLELVLPAGFVDHAAYPLTLDPLIGAHFAASSAWDDANPDVAYDVTNDQYLVVWERAFALENVDIRAQRVSGAGALIGSFLPVTISANVAARPTVANVNVVNRFLVAWQEGPSAFGPWDIMACAVNPDGTLTSQITVAATANNEVDVDAGGEATAVDDEALLVWSEVGVGIKAAQVTLPAGVGVPVAGAAVAITAGTGDGRPAISKSGGSSGRYVIAWQRFGAFFGQRAACVDRNLVILHPLLTISTGFDAQEADVDGDGTDFLIAYQRSEVAGSGPSHDIYCRMVRWDTATNTLITLTGETAVESDVNDDELDPGVGFLGPKFAVAWTDVDGFLTATIGTRELDPKTCGRCSPRGTISPVTPYNYGSAIASQRSGGGTGDECLLVFASAANTPPFAGAIQGQRWEAIGAGGSTANLGGGCGLGGTAGINGALAIGNPAFSYTLTGAGAAATVTALIVGFVGGTIPCGACTLTNPVVTVGAPIAGGNASVLGPLPCDISLIGGSAEVQWWVVVPGGPNPCPLLPTVSASNRLQITVGV